jgi:hypothetical protein
MTMQLAEQTRTTHNRQARSLSHPNSGLPEFGTFRVAEVGNIRLRLGRGLG